MSGQLRKIYMTVWMQNFTSHWTHAPQKQTINATCTIRNQKMDFCKIGGGNRVFCNPPYSQIGAWVEKAYREGQKDRTVIVLLIPSRTDTRYFHDFIYQRSEIRFVKGRLKFGEAIYNAPFPSMIVIFRGAYT